MTQAMRQSTLETLGLGTVLEIFKRGRLPVEAGELVDRVFGASGSRGALVITGANGIVGAGKTMQLGSRLEPYGIPIVAIDLPGAPPGIAKQYPGLQKAFGSGAAARIMGNVVQLSYDGSTVPAALKSYKPRFLLEAIPEILPVKRAHYELFRSAFPGIEIRSVTSGFPSHQLGVGIMHPSFPHQINKMWEIVEPAPSPITQLLWALGLIPVTVGDHWAFVLDVLFCGVTNGALRYHEATNMPFWKIDRYVRKLVGPNPFRAHDFIGAKGSNFLTWSCLHHLGQAYGELFTPAISLVERKDSGQDWYPMNHFRPVVNWNPTEEELKDLEAFVLGGLFQMASLMLHEKRSHLSQINAIGEICAQFQPGILATIRRLGAERAIGTVERYHRLHPGARSPWYPGEFEAIAGPDWQQLYVNAEHDGTVGVITLARESYNWDVNAELNRAIDWLKAAGIGRVIVTGDFHLSTQLVGADTTNFYPGIAEVEKAVEISRIWSTTARRLAAEFATSIGFVNGKRCLGGLLELLQHCHYVVALETAELGLPEVTLPVVPGMEGCHWMFRKSAQEHWGKLLSMMLEGKAVKASDGVGWLVDFAGPTEAAIQACWALATGTSQVKRRTFTEGRLPGVTAKVGGLTPATNAGMEAGRRAILDTVERSCGATLSEALMIQAKASADFMISTPCLNGVVGMAYAKSLEI
jgi:enoyl-CoA hydratase/carnithine racemase